MPRRTLNSGSSSENLPETYKPRRARTPEGRENQLIQLAVNKVEERMMNGTASAQEYIHYLRLGANRRTQKLEEEKLQLELELVRAKTEAYQSAKRSEELFENAIRQMTVYQGRGEPEDYE